MTPLLGFTPDAPTTTPGIIVDCSQFIPYESGMKAAPSAVAQGASALANATRGAATVKGLDGSTAVIVGTTAALYTLAGTTFTDRSRAGSPAYALGTDVRWSIAQFGNDTYASNTGNVIQKRTAMANAFADVSGSPQAKIIVSMLTSSGGFLFAFNTNATTDTWKNSALNDPTDWTVNPNVTLCNTGRLLGQNGPISAADQLGNDTIIAYKNRSIYVGTFVGGAAVWQFREIPGAGCIGQDALVSTGTLHYFVGEDNIYLFDGARPIPIATGQVRQWFLDNSNPNYRYACQLKYDRDADLLWLFFPGLTATSGTCDKCLVYHLGTKQWGRADRTIETAFVFATPSTNIDSLTGTIDALSGSIDSLAGGAGTRVVAVFDSAHTMQLLNGTPGTSYFVPNDIGDDTQVTRLTSVTLRYMQTPASATLNGYTSMATGGTPDAGTTQSAFDVPSNGLNRFPLRQTARFHRVQINLVGAAKVVGLQSELAPAGVR